MKIFNGLGFNGTKAPESADPMDHTGSQNAMGFTKSTHRTCSMKE